MSQRNQQRAEPRKALDREEVAKIPQRLDNYAQRGLITGAGGGGFALLLAREGQGQSLRKRLFQLQKKAAYSRSSVVEYRLNRSGIRLRE